jgi:hypothetical protein
VIATGSSCNCWYCNAGSEIATAILQLEFCFETATGTATATGTSGTLVFWYFVKLGFHFPGDLATEKVRSKCQNDPWGRAQLSRWF